MARRALPGAARPHAAGARARAAHAASAEEPPYSAGAASLLALLGAVAFVTGAALVLWPLWAAGIALVAGGLLVLQAVTAWPRPPVLTLKWESGASRSWMQTCSRFFPVQLHASAGGPGGSFSGRSTRWRGLGRCRRGAPEPLERLLATQELDALEQPR